ncbi:NAD(P)/FAD-dependent oxidoreductase [Lachnospiraceae bacterium OttesenSCG-928-E19]|nr:NAD(P)/FAD-dependent oxidoreductase [Lachnospiraceae bacterium OttesenSCG-928-E19]
MSKYDYDIIVIGLGPAGMAVSAMGAEMGLNVCAIEKENPGGECMNVGCIPSKAIIRIAEKNPDMAKPFDHIQKHLDYIREKKTMGMFEKATVVLRKGPAEFVDAHTIRVGKEKITAKTIFIATGTKAAVPPIPGIENIDYLTNDNLFALKQVPKSMVIIGGGAIGSEMADAFSKMGCKCSIVHAAPHLIPNAEPGVAKELETSFARQGIKVYNSASISHIEKQGNEIVVITESGKKIRGEKLLMAAGRKYDFSELKLENAGVEYGKKGILVNKYLRTNKKNIYAVGDCNGQFLLSHAAMHQGMIALMNSMLPLPFKKDFKKYVVPWTVFTNPEISAVGMTERQLAEKHIKYNVIESRYGDYGAAIAEDIPDGFVRVYASKYGRIYGATIVGKNSGEMINEWALAIQNKIRLHKMMFTMHSFPTMGFLNKRISEIWMMKLIKPAFVKKLIKAIF